MTRILTNVLGVVAGACLIGSLGGCPQGACEAGGPAALAAVGVKFTSCQLQDITACEFKLLVQAASDASPDIDATLTDEEATAAVDFVKANDLKCFEDLQALYECAQIDPSCATIPESLQKLIDQENAK